MLIQQTTGRDIEAERAAIDRVINGRTLCSELARTAARHADLDAIKWKVDGAWRSLTFRTYRERVCEATVAVVDADRLDMVLELRSQLPHIRHVVVCGAAGEPDPGGWVICWDELLALGRAEHQRDPFAFETSALGVDADDVATI